MPLITAPHPTYVFFRNPYEWGPFAIYLDRFARMIRGELVPPPPKQNLIIDPTVDHIRQLAALPWVTVDIETAPASKDKPWTGKDPTQARLRCVGIGTTTWAVAHLWVGNGPVKKEIAKLLADDRVCKVGHNFTWFDERVLLRYGMPVNNIKDTRDMRRALSSTSKVGLGKVATIYTDFHNWKADEEEELEGDGDALK